MGIVEKILCFILRFRDIVNGGKLYMRRFYLSPTVFGYQLRLHHILLSDPEHDPHDHPYDFWSWIIKGEYWERIFSTHHGDVSVSKLLRRRRWSRVYRQAETIHHLHLWSGSTWTIVLAGPTRRVWGYHTPSGFIPEKKYHAR